MRAHKNQASGESNLEKSRVEFLEVLQAAINLKQKEMELMTYVQTQLTEKPELYEFFAKSKVVVDLFESMSQ